MIREFDDAFAASGSLRSHTGPTPSTVKSARSTTWAEVAGSKPYPLLQLDEFRLETEQFSLVNVVGTRPRLALRDGDALHAHLGQLIGQPGDRHDDFEPGGVGVKRVERQVG